MTSKRFFDNHTHSYFSPDSRMDIADAVRTAAGRGLGGICITDHLDLDPPPGITEFTFHVPSQQKAIDQVTDEMNIGRCGQYKDFCLLKGVELGLQQISLPEIRRILSENKFDCVLASLHTIDGVDPYFGEYYVPYTYRQAYSHYLEVFLDLITQEDDFDILGHYDYIVRYPDYPQCTMYYSEYREVFDEILRFLVERGKTLEINTKTYQLYRGRHPEPDVEVLRRFRELGGEAVSFGSDAHASERLADRFDWCRELAVAAGIRYEVYFRNRKPHYITLL